MCFSLAVAMISGGLLLSGWLLQSGQALDVLFRVAMAVFVGSVAAVITRRMFSSLPDREVSEDEGPTGPSAVTGWGLPACFPRGRGALLSRIVSSLLEFLIAAHCIEHTGASGALRKGASGALFS
jgi:hypothetical protein